MITRRKMIKSLGMLPILGALPFSLEKKFLLEWTANPQEIPHGLTMTVLYDNFPTDDRLTTGWGFAVLLEKDGHTVLFDTGADGEILLENMQLMGKDPMAVETVVISHAHGDHTGGMQALVGTGARPHAYLLEGFPPQLNQSVGSRLDTTLSAPGEEIIPGIRSTGQLGISIPEQGLVIDTADGAMLLTGCAHPGVIEMTRRSAELAGGPINTVLGGFHLFQTPDEEVQEIGTEFRELGVEKVGATHCTGPTAIAWFEESFGEDFVGLGVGRILSYAL